MTGEIKSAIILTLDESGPISVRILATKISEDVNIRKTTEKIKYHLQDLINEGIVVQSKSRKNTNQYALASNVEVMTGMLELRNKKTNDTMMKETIENVLVKTDEHENVSISLLE